MNTSIETPVPGETPKSFSRFLQDSNLAALQRVLFRALAEQVENKVDIISPNEVCEVVALYDFLSDCQQLKP